MRYIKQWLNYFKFVLGILRGNFELQKIEPMIYIKNGTEDSISLVKDIISKVDFNIKMHIVADELAANTIVESKTESFGFMFVGGKLFIYIPLRDETNQQVVDFYIGVISQIFNLIGKKHEIS